MFVPNLTQAQQCYNLYNSPTFLSSQKHIKQSLGTLQDTFSSNTHFYYAIKANYNPRIISILKNAGLNGIDTVSPYEIKLAKKMGFASESIIFTGCASDNDELRHVKSEGVLLNLGSISELKRYANLFPGSEVSLRLNPGFGEGENSKVITAGEDAKFGIIEQNLSEALKICTQNNLKITGLHMHLGSGLYQSTVFEKALEFVLPIAQTLTKLDFIDLGGGFGVKYRQDQKKVDLASFERVLQKQLKISGLEHLNIRFEPGKFLVAESTAFICKVNVIKYFTDKQCLILDSGFNHLIRPSFYESYHEIINLSKPKQNLMPSKIEGYLCESGDVFHPDLKFPNSEEGDFIAILSSGAYGSCMSSIYNFRPNAAEAILNNDGNIETVRKPQNFEDIWNSMAWVD